MEADGSQWDAEVDRARDVGESVSGRGAHVEVDAVLRPPVAVRAVLLPAARIDREPVDVVGAGAAADADDVVAVIELELLALDLKAKKNYMSCMWLADLFQRLALSLRMVCTPPCMMDPLVGYVILMAHTKPW